MHFLTLLPFLTAAFALIIPAQHCNVDKVQVPVIPGLAVPAGEKTEFITLGRGFQNYTCTSGAYVSAGAVASLYDVSCLISILLPFSGPDQPSAALTSAAIRLMKYPDDKLPVKLKHFFTKTATGIAPVFVYPPTGEEVIASVKAKVTKGTDIPWLQLGATSGTLARSVFRTHTVLGQPPASCTVDGEALSVEYAAMYYFTK